MSDAAEKVMLRENDVRQHPQAAGRWLPTKTGRRHCHVAVSDGEEGSEEKVSEEKVSIEVKPGRWRERGGGIAMVEEQSHPVLKYQWFGYDSLNWPSLWDGGGWWLRPGRQHDHDLIAYLGPEDEGVKE